MVTGEFNQANMKNVFPICMWILQQEVRIRWTGFTAFKAAPHPHLGSSDHLSVMLIPAYHPLLIRNISSVKQVRMWPARAMVALQDCFEHTDWDMFKSAPEDIQEHAESVSRYIQKCMEDISVVKNITTRAKEKPWMTSEEHARLKARNNAFKSGDMVALKRARANLTHTVKNVP